MVLSGCVLVILVAVAAAQNASSEVSLLNRIADDVLRVVNEEQLRRGRQELRLNDMKHEFNKKLGFIRLRGRFTADGGWLSDVTTARRVGDVTAEREGEVTRLSAAVSWAELRVGFRHYKLDIGRDIEGSVEVKVNKNRVSAVFAFELVDGECKTSVVDFKIEELSDFDVKVTGLKFFDFLAEVIGKWFIERRKEDIVSKLEEMFKSSVPEFLEDFYCDEYATILGAPL